MGALKSLQEIAQVAMDAAAKGRAQRFERLPISWDQPWLPGFEPPSLARLGYEMPLAYGPAWHASPERFSQIDLDLGEGFGFHAGSAKAALEALEQRIQAQGVDLDPSRFADEGINPTFYDIVAKPGRSISMYDVARWNDRDNWLSNFDELRGLQPDELERFEAQLRAMGPDGDNGRDIRNALRGFGVDRVYYQNAFEDAGSPAVAFLDPKKLRWASRARFADPTKDDLLAGITGALGLGGGALGALASQERDV